MRPYEFFNENIKKKYLEEKKKMEKIDEMRLSFVYLLFARTEQEFCKYYPKHHGKWVWKVINGYPNRKRREKDGRRN